MLIAVIATCFFAYWTVARPRGRILYVDFTGLNLASNQLADGSKPSELNVKKHILAITKTEFEKGGISVIEGNKWSKPTVRYSNRTNVTRDPNGKLTSITYGSESLAPNAQVYLGSLAIPELQGKFNEEELARAIAFITMHEGGHAFLLGHADGANNVMSSSPGRGISQSDSSTIDEVVQGLKMPRGFTAAEIEKLKQAK